MKPKQVALIEHYCTKVVKQFALYNDSKCYEKLAELFTEDASFARPTAPDNFITGRENILAAFQSRPADKITRHIISNIVVDVITTTTAKAHCYATLYSSNEVFSADKVEPQTNVSQIIGEFYDDFVLTDAGWKISLRSGKIIFAP